MNKQPTIKSGKSILLQKVPTDIQQIIIDRQMSEKEDCECERSQDHAIYKMLREHKKTIGNGQVLSVAYKGEFLSITNYDVSFDDYNIRITFPVPLETGLGLALNYKRLEKEPAKEEDQS